MTTPANPLRTSALRILDEAEAAGIGASVRIGNAIVGPRTTHVLLYDHYAGSDLSAFAAFLARLENREWRACVSTIDQRQTVTFMTGRLYGVEVEWNGHHDRAREIRALLDAPAVHAEAPVAPRSVA